MRTTVIICAAILLLSLPAHAYHTRPFLGLNLQWNNPTGDFADEELAPGDGAAEPAGGIELDIGLASRAMSAYVGVRGARFNTDVPSQDYDAEWTANRFVIGLRGHLFSEEGSDVVPVIGGGVTLGRTGLEQRYYVGDIRFVSDDESESSLGWFIEGGLLAYLSSTAALNAGLQYHSFPAEFDSDQEGDRSPADFDITYVTLQMGISVFLSD